MKAEQRLEVCVLGDDGKIVVARVDEDVGVARLGQTEIANVTNVARRRGERVAQASGHI